MTSWALQVSAGGLVSALMGVSSFRTCWIGWPGAPLINATSHASHIQVCLLEPASHSAWLLIEFAAAAGVYVPEGPERDALTAALAKECYVPVYLDPKMVRTSS